MSWIIDAVHIPALPDTPSARFSRQLRRADDFIRLAVAAAEQLLDEHVLPPGPDPATGIVLGTAFGPMQTNFEVLGLIIDQNQTSPTLFSHSVFNSAAGYLARLFNIQGAGSTLTDFSWPFFQALAAGQSAIDSGRVRRCLVLQVETYSELLLEARQRICGSTSPWSPGATAWLLGNGPAPGARHLDQLEIHACPAPSTDLLTREEHLRIGETSSSLTHPLAAAAGLTELLRRPHMEKTTCILSASYGKVTLILDPGDPS